MAYPDPEIQSNPEFYPVWPLLGKRLNFQWGNERQNTAVSKAIIRAQVQDVETGDDFINADRILSGLEFGELTTNTTSFKNQFRLFYDKINDKFCIQRNTGSEATPVWIDYLCIDQGSGIVTVIGLDVGDLGLDVSGGFYGIKGYTHFQGSPNVEWIVEHNLHTPHLIVQTFNNDDRVIQFDEADTSDPDIAYFYFVTPQAGKAVLFGSGFVNRTIQISESDGTPPDFNTSHLTFDSEFFYLTSDSSGNPLVSFRGTASGGGEANTASNLGSGEEVFAQKVGVDLQFKSLVAGPGITLTPSSTEIAIAATSSGFYGITVKQSDNAAHFSGLNVIAFDTTDFYISQNAPNTDEVMVSLSARGAVSGLQNVVEDLTPELGGNLDTNSFNIVSSGFDDININSVNGMGISASTVMVVQTVSGNLSIQSGNDLELLATDVTIQASGNLDVDASRIQNVGAPVLGTDAARLQDITAAVATGFYGIFVRESDGTPSTFKNDTLIFNSPYFYLSPDSVGKPTVSIREDNLLVGHVNDFDIHKHVSGFYVIRDEDGFIDRINWNNGDFNIVNRDSGNIITSILGKHYRKTFTRDANSRIVEVKYTGV